MKFVEGSGIRIRNSGKLVPNQSKKLRSKLPEGKTSWLAIDNDLELLQSTFKYYRMKKLRPLFDLSEDKIEEMKIKGQKRKGQELADLNLYYHLSLPKNMEKYQLARLLQELNNNVVVEIAYANPIPEQATVDSPITYECPDLTFDCEGDFPPGGGGGGGGTNTATPDLENEQDYLLPASQGGIDALYAWTKAGGNGSGVDVVDIENGWNFNHEDINPAFYFNGNNATATNHGTAVIGVIGAKNDNLGVTGISFGAQVGAEGTGGTFSSRIQRAANAVGAGGVVIIEAHQQSGINLNCQCNLDQCGFIAMENWQANFDAIATAVANGVHVVEAGGNGTVNLDDPQLFGRFNRNVRDSGAILVGASLSTARTPMCWSNHGTRIDMHGFGENVTTSGYGDRFNEGTNRLYTSTFSGTSSASPIVAGAVANLQGYSLATYGTNIEPSTMRQHLVTTGTAQTNGVNIGPLPDLRNAIDSLTGGSTLLAPVVTSSSFQCFGMNSMSWNAVPTATSYQVFVGNSSSSTTVTSTWHIQSVGTPTFGRVKACNASGCSPFSNSVPLARVNYCF